jgi:hypothetical protein
MPRTIRIGFLGNCFVFGYPGVPRGDTFPEVVRRRLEGHQSGLRIQITIDSLYHPAELPQRVSRVLAKAAPDVLILDAAANVIAGTGRQAVDLTALPPVVATLADRARRGRSIAQALLARHVPIAPMVGAIDRVGQLLAERASVSYVRRHTRPTIEEYERLLSVAIARVEATRKTTLIVQGPSVFNPDESYQVFQSGAPDLYRNVNEMIARVTRAHRVTMVDRLDVAAGCGGSIFLGGSIRLSRAGHALMGQALADTLLDSHIV